MDAELNETIQEDSRPILQLNRQLLPIDKYAAREGLSYSIIEECGRLGILQIRKYKGKTYVVDVPLSPYLPACEDFPLLYEKPNANTSDTIQSARGGQPFNKANEIKKIAELAQRIASDAHGTIDELTKPAIGPFNTETMSTIKDQAAGTIKHETEHPENKLKPEQNPLSNQTRFTNPLEQLKVKRFRQVKAVFLAVCLFAILLAGLWLYMNQSINRGRLNQIATNIQIIYDDSIRTSQQIATLQNKLVEFTAESEWAKNELNNNKAETTSLHEEIKSLQNELAAIKQGLETIQQHNTTTLEQLREQLRQLTDKIEKVVNNKTPSGSSAKGGASK
jgi:DNA repair exonuclease SbcCD ATPase subunit